MNTFLKRLASDAAQPVEDMLSRFVITLALIILAVGCVIAASAFLTVDLFLYIEEKSTPIVAAGSVAGVYIVFALVLFWLALRKPKRPAEPPPPALSKLAVAAAPPPVADAPQKLFSMRSSHARPTKEEFGANIDAAVAPIVSAMREAGMAKEAQAVEAGGQVAKQLSPYALLLAAAGAGVFLGRTLATHRKLF